MSTNPQTTAELRELDRRHHLHPFTEYEDYCRRGGRIFSRAEHVYIEDTDGNRLLDGMSGLWCVNLGYSQPRIVEAITRQLNTLPFYNSFFKCSNDTAARLAAELATVFPAGFSRFFFTNSGSEANDTNLRIVYRYFDLIGKPGKKLIVSRRNAYHGSTIAAGSLGGMDNIRDQFPSLPFVHHVMQPYWFGESNAGESPDAFAARAAQAVADGIDRLGADNVAAFIAEPVQGAGGVIIPPPGYWPRVEAICRERDVLLISDEVICGFGRTGHWFGCDSFGVTPDLMTFAKAVTNGYQPLGGVAVSDRIADVLTSQGGEFAHGFTYSGHPVPCAAALATLSILKEQDIPARAARMGQVLRDKLAPLADHPLVGEIRTHGMLAAVELVADKASRRRLEADGGATVRCRDHAIDAGLMVRAVGDAIVTAPPLIVSEGEVDLLVSRLTRALDLTARHYGRSGD
ncbi:MAG: aminotransferase class III-fold pyridoxal phosphate-dependent enzyme [Pseudomonadales bacterium]|nr:aminotransferase class III-fold pyridoxal phosphate-dependent enzyme [Pseudomonadales bacterium]